MYRLQIYFKKHWKCGINTYPTFESASIRAEELKKIGIKARIKSEGELLK